ncbi:hypothetical protein K466DRAFT_270692 [Polyporus arcularius HHB13444]|uniref:Uncharacterized protein n=1 Tax=Polyporus arcularius HHB13444 TaxID=1314778 RepID=A0A5C3PQW9_9APHY|nr:hypothetical protein K466DRAFT_270692 [Polyporus arcularius HHB13444]
MVKMILTRAFFISAMFVGVAYTAPVVSTRGMVRDEAGCRQAGCLRAIPATASKSEDVQPAMMPTQDTGRALLMSTADSEANVVKVTDTNDGHSGISAIANAFNWSRNIDPRTVALQVVDTIPITPSYLC